MTHADTVQVRHRRADIPSKHSPERPTEENEDLREALRKAGPANPAPAIAHYLNPDAGHPPELVASAASYFFQDWVQPPASSAAISTLIPLDTAGSHGAPDFLQRFWNIVAQFEESHEDFRHSDPGEKKSVEQPPGWLDEIRKSLGEIRMLGRDWDGHGAAPISNEACDYALKFVIALTPPIKRFEPFPEPDGSVGLEYHKDDRFSLYLSFSPEGTLAYVAVFRNAEGKEEIHRGDGVKVNKEIPQRIRQFLDISV